MKPDDRLILGHPSCPQALRSLLGQLCGLPAGRPLRLVFPPVTPLLEPFLEEILQAAGAFTDLELIANDWGTLSRLSRWKKDRTHPPRLILGVLISGQDTDPMLRSFLEPQPDRTVFSGEDIVLLRWAAPPETLIRHWSVPSAFHWTELLREMDVDAVELGLQPFPLPASEDALPVVSFPAGVLSVLPCRGCCEQCGGKETIRAGVRLYYDRNLLLWGKKNP